MSYSWDQIRSQIRQFRTNLQSVYPMQVLAIIKDFVIYKNSLFFLSNNSNSTDVTPFRNLQLYQIKLDSMNQYDDNTTIEVNTDREYLISISNIPILKRQAVFMEYTALNDNKPHTPCRFPLSGVSSFQIVDDTFLCIFQNNLYIGELGKVPRSIPSSIQNTTDTTEENRLDAKLSCSKNLIAFIRNRDIWLTDIEGNETQLTFCSLNKLDTTLKCGIAEYMMQEEFHRFTGFYWSPDTSIERILYLETSELNVEQVFISNSAADQEQTKTSNSIRYPRAGQANAKSELKLVEFMLDDTGHPINIVHKKLWGRNDIKKQFPWMEYIVRFGWFSDGQCVWLQILSRDQKKTAVLKLDVCQFSKDSNETKQSEIEILWEEENTNWINVTDVYYFLSTSSANHARMIWSSEKGNGYRHLYYVEKRKGQKESSVRQLTEGEWCCVDRPLFVDESRSLVYFSAKLHTPLETHFYVLNYSTRQTPKLLTRLGFSHTVTMNSPDYFIDCFSTLHDPQVTMVQRLNHSIGRADRFGLLMPVALKRQVETPPSPPFINSILNHAPFNHYSQTPPTKYQDSIEPNGETFSFNTSDGLKLYGCLYKPRCYEPGQSYPTVLHIYGGPKTQLVVNEFKFPRLVRYLMSVYFGFAVVIIDSRGSSDRGLQFESYIRHSLGQVELRDQLEGLQYLHASQFGALSTEDGKKEPVIDLNRVAITGWSYGGYLSLMAIAQYPHRFKMAIAGAPVTQWELYDAAYTERYMGFPVDNAEAYRSSSVLTYINQFPDEEHRLLIAHGLIDENVHFRNTETLVSQLVKYKKPHYLQVYPSEKHGLRHASVNEHFEILMFYWLANYL